MAAKASAPTAAVTVNKISRWNQWVVPGDPNDPTSKPMFIPWYISIGKEGNFKLKHGGDAEPIIKKKLEVIFLSGLNAVHCNCTVRGDDSGKVICKSHDRVISNTGYLCKEECPHGGTDANGNKVCSRRLGKDAVILFREEGSDDTFKLARYISALNNVNDLNTLKDNFRKLLVSRGVANPYPSSHVCIISATKESINGGKGSVGRFNKDVELGIELDEDAVKAVNELNKGVVAWFENLWSKQSEYNKRVREKRLAALGALQSDAPEKRATATAQQTQFTPNQAAMQQTPVYSDPIPFDTDNDDPIGNEIVDGGDDENW